MKPHILLLISLQLLLLISCNMEADCKDGPSTSHIYHYLTAIEKSTIPYKGKDTLRFVSNSGDTAVLIGQGAKQNFDVSSSMLNPDCGYYRLSHYEVRTMEFEDAKMIFNKFNIIHRKQNGGVYFSLNDYNFIIADDQIGDNRMSSYRDSMQINFKTFYGVHIVKEKYDTISYLVLNQQEGIIQINHKTLGVWNKQL